MEARRVGEVILVDGDAWYIEWDGRRFAIDLAKAHGTRLRPGMRLSFIAQQKKLGEWEATRIMDVAFRPPPSAAELHARH